MIVKSGTCFLISRQSSILDRLAVAQADVVGLALHRVEVVHGVQEGAGDVAHVDVVALEVRLEQHDEAVGDGAVGEVVDEQVEAHARADAEDGGEPQGDARPAPSSASSSSTLSRRRARRGAAASPRCRRRRPGRCRSRCWWWAR